MADSLIATNFGRFAGIFSPSLTGGLLNLIYKPTEIREFTGPVLTFNDINMDLIVTYFKALLLTTKQEYPVLDVLPPEVKPDEIKNSAYITEIIILGVAFLLTVGLWIGTLVIPCIFCCSKKKGKSGGSSSKGCIIATGVITAVLVIFLALCLPLVYIAISSLVTGIDGKATDGENSGLKNTVHVVVREASLFLKDIPTRGRTVTNDLLVYLQNDLTQSLSELVKKILKELLTRYNVRLLISKAATLSGDVNKLQSIIYYVQDAKTKTVMEILKFNNKRNRLQYSLKTSIAGLCRALQGLRATECNELLAKIKNLKYDFDGRKLTLSDELLRLVSSFGSDVKIVLEKLANLENKLDKQIEETISQIENNFNLTQQLQPVLQLWDQLGTEVSGPIIEQLNQIEPTADDLLTTVSMFTKLGGLIILVLFTLVLVIMVIFGVIAAIQGTRDSSGPRFDLCCGLIVPVLFCFLIPLVVLICGVTVLLSGIVANEGCRYVGNPSGVVVSDEAINLYVKYLWPQLMSEKFVDQSIKAMLDIPVPKNVINAILVQCKSSETLDPGLLPLLGVDHFLNATAVTSHPELKKAIKDTEESLVSKILEFDFTSVLPGNLEEIQKLIDDLENILSQPQYENAISELEKVLKYPSSFIELLDRLEVFIKQITQQPGDMRKIQNIINDMRKVLQDAFGLTNSVTQLIDSFEVLQRSTELLEQIRQFSKILQDVVSTLTTREKLEAPIRDVYQSGVEEAMNILIKLLEQASTGFTSEVLKCGNINVIVTSVIEATCANDGLINRFGGFFFMMLLYLCPLLLTVLFYQIFLQRHAKS